MRLINAKLLKLFFLTTIICNVSANQNNILQNINIGYDNVTLSESGITDFYNKINNDFFNPEYNKFKNYEDCKFAANYLGKLVESFHDEIKTGKYLNNTNEIIKIKSIFNGVLLNIITKKDKIKSTFTLDEKLNMNSLIDKVIYTISKSNDINSNTITEWE